MVSVAETLNVVSRLLAPDPDVRGAAYDQLTAWGEQSFSTEVAEVLFAAAEGTYPEVSAAVPVPPNEALVAVLWHDARNVDPEIVAKSLPRLRGDARWAAVRVLAENPSAKAAVCLGRELRRVAGDEVTPAPTYPVLEPLHRRPDDADILGPGLLGLLRNPRWMAAAAGVLLTYAEAGTLDRHYSLEIAAIVRPRISYELVELRVEWQSSGPAVRWDERSDYAERRATTGLLLNLLGSMRRLAPDPLLLPALAHPDPWISLWAAVSLLRQEDPPPAEALARIAADPECRVVLVKILEETRRVDLVPLELRTQDLLAESEMVRWLIYPTELGRAPDDIEALAVRPMRHPDGVADLHVFRFRVREPHWAAEQGWMVGIAGPYLRDAQPTARSLNATFSRFEPYDPERLDESVRSIIDALTEHPPVNRARSGGAAPWRPFRRRRS